MAAGEVRLLFCSSGDRYKGNVGSKICGTYVPIRSVLPETAHKKNSVAESDRAYETERVQGTLGQQNA